MAKKYKSTKLLKTAITAPQKTGSAFGKHANRLADARKKKIQRLTDTQKRVMQSKKNNKMIKISKKAKKFALLDEENEHDQEVLKLSLTHKGVKIRDLKEFDDVALGQSDLENDEEFDQIQQKMNFAGFEATDNLLEENHKQGDDKRQKTKNEVYKQIIEKSKAYKMLRQQQYEENFNKANELDEGFDSLLPQLKFRNKDQQMLERLQGRDLEYDKLLNELRDDERVVSNKIVEKNEKYTEKIRKKKNEQLNKLMKDSSDEEDIRGWVDDEAEDEDESVENEEGSQEQGDYDEDGEQEDGEEGSYDELDDVQLSSEEQGQELEGEQGDQQQAEVEDQEQAQGDQELQEEQDEDEEQDLDSQQDEDQEDQESDEQQEQESQVPPPKSNKRNNQQQKSQPSKQSNAVSKQVPQKKRKLNFVQ